jgi:hypothetical protein
VVVDEINIEGSPLLEAGMIRRSAVTVTLRSSAA